MTWLDDVPDRGIIAILDPICGEDLVTIIRAAVKREINTVLVSRWTAALAYLEDHAPDTFGRVQMLHGPKDWARLQLRDECLSAVCSMRAPLTDEERKEWAPKMRRQVFVEG